MKIQGSSALIAALVKEGVAVIFGYPGGAIMPTYDALYDVGAKLKHVLVRHEQGAAFAAIGYARATGKIGVCLSTSGPGATNLITGIGDAMLDSIPLVCITGQVMSHLLGTDAFQESDTVGITVPITKWNYQITRAAEIPEIMEKAFRIASSGRPGPVVIDITKDAQVEYFDYDPTSSPKHFYAYEKSEVNISDIIEAADLINQAKRPFVFAGHGIFISKAESEFKAFVEKAQLPVACTLLGLTTFPLEHPLFKGWLGMHGNYAPNILSNEADLIIAVGMRFDDRVTGDLSRYLKQAKIIHIEIDPSEIDRKVKADIALNVDAKVALNALLPRIHEAKHEDWLRRFDELKAIETEKVISKETHPQKGKIKMGEAIKLLSDKTKGEAIVVPDAGQHQMMVARYYEFRSPNSHISGGGLAAMGFSLPASIGVKFGNPDREVISISGDGGFQMNLQELAVIAQENLPVKIIILNNGYLGMVRQWQELFFEKRYAFTEIFSPDFVMLAKSYGIEGAKVDTRENLSEALDKLLASKKAYLLEIIVERQDNVFPMIAPGDSVSEIQLEARQS